MLEGVALLQGLAECGHCGRRIDRQMRMAPVRTAGDTVDPVRRLAAHHADRMIASVLNRQNRSTATGLRFTASRAASLRRSWRIPRFQPVGPAAEGELLSVRQAARELEVSPSTLHCLVNDGFLPAEQVAPGAPWRIRLDEPMRARFQAELPAGYVAMREAVRRLGVSRQTVVQWFKRGKLDAVMIYRGKRKGLAIKVVGPGPSLFERPE